MVTLGCMPVHEEVSIDKGIDVWANFGTHYFLERREIGIFNIGDGAGTVTADGKEYHLNYKDCLYLTKGNQKVIFKSDDPEHPAKFYMVSAPAHCSYENKLITIEQAANARWQRRDLQQAHDQPVHPSQRAQDLPAVHGYDRSGARQQLEHHAQPHPRAPHGDLHLL